MFKRYSFVEYMIFAEAWLFLAFSRLLIVFRPFRKLLPYLGKSINEKEATRENNQIEAPVVFLQLVQVAIQRAGKRSPWRTLCYEQALAARMMLRRRKIKSIIYFGLRKNADIAEKSLSAHAWLVCSGYCITGEKKNDNYSVVGRFFH